MHLIEHEMTGRRIQVQNIHSKLNNVYSDIKRMHFVSNPNHTVR